MRTTPEQKQRQCRSIYEIMSVTPRITRKDIAAMMNLDARTISGRIKEAKEFQHIVGPETRKKSYKNLREYMYFVKCEEPEISYLKYREDQNIVYHAQMIGFCDLWIIAKEKMDIDGEVVIEGYRSDYYTSFAPDHSWEAAMENIKKKTEIFEPQYAASCKYIQTHFDKIIEWTPEDELLYRYFKYDLRKPLTPPIKEPGIWERNIYNFLERLPETCTIETSYYPDGARAYDPYLFMFETDYEDFVIDLFSELPTTTWFFRVSNTLFVLAHVSKPFMKSKDLLETVNKWYIPLLLIDLSEKNFVKKRARADVDYFWGKSI